MARLAMGEALTNLCWAPATALCDVKASVNWMYAAKMKSEGAAMYEAACALRWVAGRARPACVCVCVCVCVCACVCSVC
jgi:phosphoribosylformylglycinamidine (FGAM) synthase-like enzyme